MTAFNKGPALSQGIMNVILRFRTHRKALGGDIKKTFLNVSIAEKDKDFSGFMI